MTSKKGLLLVLLTVLILALAIGYAAFSDTLTISGTASASGKFDLEFTEGTGLVSSKGVNETDTVATISDDKDTLSITVADLSYPGAGAQFKAVIKNTGTVAAKVKGLTASNITGADAIKITGLDAITDGHDVIEPNGTCTILFNVEWDKDKDLTNENGDSVSFSLAIDYEQSTELFSAEVGHSDN